MVYLLRPQIVDHMDEEIRTWKCLLLQDVDRLGQAGEVKRVADGYARNFLFPRELAVLATPGAVRQAENQKKARYAAKPRPSPRPRPWLPGLDGMTVTFEARAGETGRLYGSITNANIADSLSEKVDQDVDRRKIDMDEPLKELGTHAVTIRLAAEAEAKVTVIIEREEEAQE